MSTEMTTLEVADIALLLDALRTREYLSRKYRFKGDEYYEIGNHRFSMEYHNLAAQEEREARAILVRLEASLGPAGSLPLPDSQQMRDRRERADALPSPWLEGEDFDRACFVGRYPLWTRFIAELWNAYEKWKDDPRFWAEAPKFRPIDNSWRP